MYKTKTNFQYLLNIKKPRRFFERLNFHNNSILSINKLENEKLNFIIFNINYI